MGPDETVSAVQLAIDRSEEIARAASPGPWSAGDVDEDGKFFGRYGDVGWYVLGPMGSAEFEDSEQGLADAVFVAANDPASALRRVAADRRVLERHRPVDDPVVVEARPFCGGCSDVEWHNRREVWIYRTGDPTDIVPWPCDEYVDLADRYGIEVTT